VIRIAAPTTEPTVERRVFEAWSIEVPAAFAETFVDADCYWHAYDEHRSVSLTSFVISEERDPVSASRILQQAPPLDGSPVDHVPRGLQGRAATGAAPQPARASQLLSGLLATDGRLLVVTVTSDDLEWARRVWLSIRSHAVQFESLRGRPKGWARQRRGHYN
jgi:hypothetical protein